MINNRLFKKINAIFWGIITFLPIVIFVLILFKTEGVQFDNQYTPYTYMSHFCNGFMELMGFDTDATFSNPLSPIFNDIYNLAFGEFGYSTFMYCLLEICSWACFVQVMRLLVYVFMWFIDLISGLFDLMTFNRKGDN